MNILFITVADMRSVEPHGIYSDLMREFLKNGHTVCIASPAERRHRLSTGIIKSKDWGQRLQILKVQTGNIQKTNIIEKGISTILLERQLKNGIKKYFSDIKFDLILYTTPPITLVSPIKYIRARDGAFSYLMLKDIFPQNAIDIGLLSKRGLKGLLYKRFKKKEKKLYTISDYIGCMSMANVDYLLSHNTYLNKDKVEVCPNSVEIMDMSVTDQQKTEIREKYSIPLDKKVFVYGGNLGKPQGIDFVIECLKKQSEDGAFFLIVGNGTEYKKLKDFINAMKPENVKLMNRLPQEDYDAMVGACDIGLIFLDYRFTIPNFPSRLLGYMQAKLPIMAVTDSNTDIGKVIVDGGFGWWCESNDADNFCLQVRRAVNESDITFNMMKKREWKYLVENYAVSHCYETVVNHLRCK